jgi:hypothetical protein
MMKALLDYSLLLGSYEMFASSMEFSSSFWFACAAHLFVSGMKCFYKSQFYCFRKILAMGFDEKFFRTWEYYFLYCAAGFKSCTLGDYQVQINSMSFLHVVFYCFCEAVIELS